MSIDPQGYQVLVSSKERVRLDLTRQELTQVLCEHLQQPEALLSCIK